MGHDNPTQVLKQVFKGKSQGHCLAGESPMSGFFLENTWQHLRENHSAKGGTIILAQKRQYRS